MTTDYQSNLDKNHHDSSLSVVNSSPQSPHTQSTPTSPISSNPPLENPQDPSLPLKPHAQARLLSSIDKCKVCGEPAAKHIHYGAVSCFSCRAFFRRSIQNNTAQSYVCRRNKDCSVNLKTRRNCQYCRYECCLAVGMKPSWVLSPEERDRRFKKKRDIKNSKLENVEDGEDLILNEVNVRPVTVIQTIRLPQSTDTQKIQFIPQTNHISMPFDHNGMQPMTCIKKEIVISPSTSPKEEPHWQAPPQTVISKKHQQIEKEEDTYTASSPITYGVRSPPPLVPSNSRQLPSYSATSLSNGINGVIVQRQTYPVPLVQEPISLSLVPKRSYVASAQQQVLQSTSNSAVSQTYSVPQNNHQVCETFTPQSNFSSFDERHTHMSLTPTNIPIQSESLSTQRSPLACPSEINEATMVSWPHQSKVDFFYEERESKISGMEEDFDYEDSNHSRSSLEEQTVSQRLNLEPQFRFSNDELSQLQMLVTDHDERYRSVNFGESLIKEMIMCSMFGIPVSASAAISGYRLTVERMTRIAQNNNLFSELPKSDQDLLFKENADQMVSLRGAIFFDSKKKGVNQVLISIGVDDVEKLKTMFDPIMKEEKMKHIDYKTFNSIQQVNNNEVETRYNYLQKKVGEGIVDDITTILLTYIILFSVDFCPLSNRRKVEQIQENYIKILQRYIYSHSNRNEACAKMAAALGSVTCLREMADIKKQRAMNQSMKLPT